jgi:GTPase SAR1 family protein
MDVAGSSNSKMKKDKKPVTIITIGMAGAGKTTFVQRINAYLHSLTPPSPPYILNLDPAVTRVPYEANIDIRDTVNYQEVMKQFVSDTFFSLFLPILVALMNRQ